MWIARNRNGGLYLFYEKPYREQNWRWVIDNKTLKIIELDDDNFPEYKDLKWEDPPMEVDLIPKQIIEYPKSMMLTKYYEDFDKERAWFMNMLNHQNNYKDLPADEKENVWKNHIHFNIDEDEISSIVQDDNSTLIYYLIRHPNAQIQYERVVETKEEIEKYFGREF